MEGHKTHANELFKNGKYQEAFDQYTKAIEAEPPTKDTATCYGNRSFAACKLEQFGQALSDANKAIELDPLYIKAYYRRAAAYMALNKHKLALDDFKKVEQLQVQLNNPDKFINAKIKECEKLIARLAFERAIRVDARKEKPLAYTTDCDSIAVESDYDGPRLKNHKKVTEGFILELIKHLRDCKRLHRRYVLEILCQIYKFFVEQPTLVDISIKDGEKFNVVGDVHGQFYDLLNIFENVSGLPSETNPYLFNGDIVDRGSFGMECVILLFSFKLLYPKHFFISRGNHEAHTMNQMYGFEGECKRKYSQNIYDFFVQVFQVLPLAHCLTGLGSDGQKASKVLVMHGGLFSEPKITLDDIRKIDRNQQPPNEGIMCEILWSDPMDADGRAPSKRGTAIAFGPDVTREFCAHNDLDYIIRSHEVKQEGYEVAHDGKCITVFSAPNYCDAMGNLGAIITLTAPKLEPQFKKFGSVEHPNIKPMAYANHLAGLF